ncbi:putative B3 domain-containing protein [Panicum miliaceum]|uniref:B3 domain-containing protein n=1 Tax=Panicum miliaceum TaxID=4540 RepID=A0A3L6PY66_PANMI|nr:putative B3 domain-containing protein [Panicum miliaceum]
MASSGNHGAAKAKDLRVLVPFTCDSLRLPDKVAEEVGAGLDGSAEVLVVGPRNKVWRVEVGWDGDGAFLGRGWPEFADVCGVEGGWFLVVRHRGRGLLTVKAFDRSCCLRELGTPPQQDVINHHLSIGLIF